MSMIGSFLLVEDETLGRLLEAPESIHALLEERVQQAEAPKDYVDVDKAWHALHFLLTSTAWEGEPPLDFIASGGACIGEEDVGYGPARALRKEAVVSLARALEGITTATLVERYDGRKMAQLEIYPQGWTDLDPRNGDEFGYFTSAFEDLAALVRKGAATGRGLLVWIS